MANYEEVAVSFLYLDGAAKNRLKNQMKGDIGMLMPHCHVSVYRDVVCSLSFHNLYPPSFRRNDFLYLYI